MEGVPLPENFNWNIPGFLGMLSCAGSLSVIFSYTSLSALRKHPSVMVLFLSLCDFMYSFKFAVECTAYLPNFPHDWCILSALWGQFWGMASISWNAMLSVNIIISLRDPFKFTANYLKFYHIFVWSLAASTTLVLFFMRDHLGHSEGEYICGITQQDDALHLLFYLPLFSYMLLGFYCLGLSTRRIAKLKNPNLFHPLYTTKDLPNPWSHGTISEDKTEMYFMGVIDFLQLFNLTKKVEFFLKTKLLCYDSGGLSAVPPLQYSTRFLDAMQKMLQHDIDPEADLDYGFIIVERNGKKS